MTGDLINLITLKKVEDDCQLVIADSNSLPFKFKRVYLILDPVKDLPRGYHAHHKNIQAIFCLKGTAKIIIDSGYQRQTVVLDKPNQGILLNKMIWHEMHDLDEDSQLMVFASHDFDEKDYIRSYSDFLGLVRKK